MQLSGGSVMRTLITIRGRRGGKQMEQDLYAAGYAAGLKQGQADKQLWIDDAVGMYKRSIEDKDFIGPVSPIRDLLSEVSDFLDNYTDAEYIDGRPVGNRAMNLKSSIDELL
jgi:hypothetical protein